MPENGRTENRIFSVHPFSGMVSPKIIRVVGKCAQYIVVYEPRSRIVRIFDNLRILSEMTKYHNVSSCFMAGQSPS